MDDLFFFGEHNDNLQTRLSNKKMVGQLSMILAVKSKLAELGHSDCFTICWRLLNGDVCSSYPGLQEGGWGGGGWLGRLLECQLILIFSRR